MKENYHVFVNIDDLMTYYYFWLIGGFGLALVDIDFCCFVY